MEGTSYRPVFFFDIDNCLYSRNTKVSELMGGLIGLFFHPKLTILGTDWDIDKFFAEHLALSQDDATMLHQKYYREYGLAIEGLVRHHKVDPLEYNQKVDDALPLDGLITPDPKLRKLLQDFDKSKVRLWLFTNAHISHGLRVIKLLEIEDLFDGITYCDYTQKTLVCKPHKAMFEKAEAEAGVTSSQSCFFVDDSYLNCKHAQARGWTTVHLLEPSDPEPATKAAKHHIRNLEELRVIFPQFFTTTDATTNPARD